MTTISVPIEKEASQFRMDSDQAAMCHTLIYNVNDEVRAIIVDIDGNPCPAILGKLSELTDEQCKGLVEAIQSDRGEVYQNYESEFQGAFHWTAKQSLISKLKSEGKVCKWMNPQVCNCNYLNEYNDTNICQGCGKIQSINSFPDDFLILVKP